MRIIYPDGYFGGKSVAEHYSTAARLDLFFAHNVLRAGNMHNGFKSNTNFDTLKRKFIHGLETAIKDEYLPESGNITKDDLRQMIKLANQDWSDVKTIKNLYRYHHQIRGIKYKERELFPSKVTKTVQGKRFQRYLNIEEAIINYQNSISETH